MTDKKDVDKFVDSYGVEFSDKNKKQSILKKRKTNKMMDAFVKEYGD